MKNESHPQFLTHKSKSSPNLPVSFQLQTKLHFEESFRDILIDKDKALESLDYLESNIHIEMSENYFFYNPNIIIIQNNSESTYYDSSIKDILKCI